MPEQYDLEFEPVRRRRKGLVTRFLLGFGAIFLLLVIASAFAMQRDGFLDRFIRTYIRPTETETETQPNQWNYTGSATLLLSQTDAAAQSLRFVFLVRADAAQKSILIFPLSPKAKAPYGGREITLEQALRAGGVKELQAAVEALTESKIDRYITADDAAFTNTVNWMGSVKLQLEQGIRYRGDFDLTLAKGTSSLSGDMLLRYFRYLGTRKEDPPLAQGELLRMVLETYLVPKNAQGAAALEKKFEELSKRLETDISITDFYTQRDLLLALLAEDGQIQIEVKE